MRVVTYMAFYWCSVLTYALTVFRFKIKGVEVWLTLNVTFQGHSQVNAMVPVPLYSPQILVPNQCSILICPNPTITWATRSWNVSDLELDQSRSLKFKSKETFKPPQKTSLKVIHVLTRLLLTEKSEWPCTWSVKATQYQIYWCGWTAQTELPICVW